MKKRILSIVLTICMVLAFMPQTAFAATSGLFGTNLTWTLEENGTLTISGTGAMTDWSSSSDVPWYNNCSSIRTVVINYGVTSIGDLAFIDCNNLTSVTIPNSVTSIGIGAFSNCTGLTSVTIPNSVTSIMGSAFQGCTSLASITIPSSVTSIGGYAFQNCTGLTSVDITYGVKTIETEAFRGCTGLTSVTIPNSVISIKGYAFQDCTSLTSVTIPSSVTSIVFNTFQGCTSLTSVTIPSSVTSIENNAFVGCTGLTSITIPNSVTSIGASAFRDCTGLTSIMMPNSVTSIGPNAFKGCTSLTSVTIPNSVTSIATGTFEGCTGLTSVTIPNSVTDIRYDAFKDCTGLTTIFLPDNNLNISEGAIPNTASQVKYSLDAEVKVTITGITLGTGKNSVTIPATICGYPVVAVADGLLGNISSHTCVGGQATCQTKATCRICGNEYGELLNHNLENIPAKDATVTETGNKEYWHCKDCGKYFSDENGKSEINDLSAWKAEEGKLAKLPPEIINGKGMSITAGETKELTFRSNADFSDFIRVELDGKILDAKYYTAKEGSTIITLKADYVASLSTGNHTIGIVSTSGTATTEFTVNAQTASGNDSPKTGDNSNLLLWLALMILSASGTAGAVAYFRKNRTNK